MSITSSSVGTTTTFTPTEVLYDPTNKLRTSNPQALIDTDFEYGTQVSKWENLAIVNNKPFAFSSANAIPQIGSMTFASNTRTVTVVLNSGVAPANGTPIYVTDSLLSQCNGNFIIDTGGGTNTFSYTARATNSTAFTAVFDPYKTSVYQGTLYSNVTLGATGSYSVTLNSTNPKIVTVQCQNPHGLALGNELYIKGITGSNPPNGVTEVCSVLNPTTFSYTALATPSSLTVTGMDVYVRPQGQFLHRPFDGGVIFSSNGNSNYEAAIRQTRRYFRYQSGKGVQVSSGTILKPNLQVDSITSSGLTAGSVITVQTKEKHNIQTGTSVTISGVTNDTAYNGTYTVASVTGYNTFTLTSPALTSLTAAGTYYVSVNGWYGAQNRLGMFDDQNGVFFEFDGQTMYAVRRNSTFQLPGRYSVTNGSNTVTQTSSSFPTLNLQELVIGNFVVIRGQSYRVIDITDNTSFSITPAYRGVTASMVQVTKTIDVKIPQSQWNIDKADGTGASGYTLDLTKMQMFYIDYTWYGAGFIRWGLRMANGNVTYVHKLANNNVNTEAYMRSGNLPARYETRLDPIYTRMLASLATGDGTVSVADTSAFPSSGTILVRDINKYEFINYTGKTATTFTGCVREKAGMITPATLTIAAGSNVGTLSSLTGIQVGQKVYDLVNNGIPEGAFIVSINTGASSITLNVAATLANPTVTIPPMGNGQPQAFTYTAGVTAPLSVELAWPSFAPTISHWGTSVIMDGRFDDDKSLLFTYGQNTFTTLGASNGTTATGNVSNVSTAVTLTATNALILPGMTITGTNIAAGTTVVSIVGTALVMSQAGASTNATAALTFTGLQSKALMSIRVSPSVDNGTTGAFGARELINRMQLVLRALDVTTRTASANLLVTAILNGTPSAAVTYTNAVRNDATLANSSLAQIADYAGGAVTVVGGETTGGFFLNQTTSIDLSLVRDLGNSIMGGGTTLSNQAIYPDGPDVLTIVVTNLNNAATADVVSRLSWTEAQA